MGNTLMDQLTESFKFLAEQYLIGKIDGQTFQNRVADLCSALQNKNSSAIADWIITYTGGKH